MWLAIGAMRDTAAGSRLLTRLPYSEMVWALQEMLKEDRPRNHPQVVRQGDRSETGGRAVPRRRVTPP